MVHIPALGSARVNGRMGPVSYFPGYMPRCSAVGPKKNKIRAAKGRSGCRVRLRAGPRTSARCPQPQGTSQPQGASQHKDILHPLLPPGHLPTSRGPALPHPTGKQLPVPHLREFKVRGDSSCVGSQIPSHPESSPLLFRAATALGLSELMGALRSLPKPRPKSAQPPHLIKQDTSNGKIFQASGHPSLSRKLGCPHCQGSRDLGSGESCPQAGAQPQGEA